LDNLISKEYRELQEKYHQDCENWGTSGANWGVDVLEFIQMTDAITVLDYGCGKNTLYENIKYDLEEDVNWTSYDPCIPEFSDKPEYADVVVCTDVLEHVEPDLIENVLDDIAKISYLGAFLVIFTHPASHKLPDGSNCHKICKGEGFWRPLLEDRFKHVDIRKGAGDELICEVYHAD